MRVSGLLILLLFSLASFGQNTCSKASMIIKTIQKHHYKPRAVDDKFSSLVFNEWISLLDADGLLFTKAELEQLKAYENSIDDELLNENCSILEKVTELYTRKLNWADSLVSSFRTQKFEFSKTEELTVSKDTVYVSNHELTERWRKWVKLAILSSYVSNPDSLDALQKPSADSIAKIQQDVIAHELCWIKSRLNFSGGIPHYVGSDYLKALAMAFDPHTEYFSPAEKGEFWSSLSRETYSFGFDLDRNDLGEIEIYGITPGSPAWKSNSLNEGDIILSANAKGQLKDFTCIAMEEAIRFIAAEDVKEASFRIRKMNRTEINITLHKEKSNVEENVIKSFVLQGTHKIGYIYLPAFYSEPDNGSVLPNGCANDVAKELIKLKKEGIKGLIFDLRNNGGGSVLEAIQLSGIFIDYGALGIVHGRDQEPVTMKDINRGTIFNEPLVILQNPFSASASEMFAGSMQDYKRAVIVGTHSFGKATVQSVIPVDAYKYDNADDAPNSDEGYLKLTISKYYRVNGTSHQFAGIKPDIEIPDVYQELQLGESSYPSALQASTIDKKTYYYPLTPLPLEELKTRSGQRVKTNPAFISVSKSAKSIATDEENYSIPLHYDAFIAYCKSTIQDEEEDDATAETDSLFTVQNPEYIKGLSSASSSEKEVDENLMLHIQEDTPIRESYHIITDLINLTLKN